MVLLNHILKVPIWCSTRVYSPIPQKKVALILNQINNEYALLDEESAFLWEFITKNSNYNEILKYAKTKNLQEELDNFLNELIELGFLIKENQKEKSIKVKNFETNQTFDETKQKEFISFQDSFFSFLEENGYLPRLFIEATNNCNLSCIHCYNDKNAKEIKFKDLKNIIDEAEELGVFYVTLSGGECTLNKDFLEIIKYIRKKRIALDFFTNGQSLHDNKSLCDKIIDLYPYKVSLSLYSMNPEIHDSITRVNGSHEKTISTIKYLKERNINIEIKCFLTKINVNDYLDVQTFAKENGLNFTLDYRLINNKDKSNKNIGIDNEKQLLKIFLDKKSCLYAKNIETNEINDDFLNNRICNGGYSSLSISPDLNVYICPALKIPLGNLKTKSLKSIWEDKSPTSNLQKIKKLKKIELQECYKYDYCKYCNYCPAISYNSGRYLKPNNNFCEEAKTKQKAVELSQND